MMHSGVKRLNELKGLFAGLALGVLLLLLFQVVGPFVEIYVMEHAAEGGAENYESVIGNSFIYISYFLAANFVIVFCSSYLAAVLSKQKKRFYSLISGSIFLAFILFNGELLASNAVLYGGSILLGVCAMMSTLFFTRERKEAKGIP
jgi:hypothetical protein